MQFFGSSTAPNINYYTYGVILVVLSTMTVLVSLFLGTKSFLMKNHMTQLCTKNSNHVQSRSKNVAAAAAMRPPLTPDSVSESRKMIGSDNLDLNSRSPNDSDSLEEEEQKEQENDEENLSRKSASTNPKKSRVSRLRAQRKAPALNTVDKRLKKKARKKKLGSKLGTAQSVKKKKKGWKRPSEMDQLTK